MNTPGESKRFNMTTQEASRRYDDAHGTLDLLFVPRKIGKSNLSVSGRIEWIRDNCPEEYAALCDAIWVIVQAEHKHE